jgi:uncharacterized protein YegL
MDEQLETLASDDIFASNPEPRCPCVLLLDVSGSMAGQPIGELNAGLVTFKEEIAADALARKRVEVAIVTFGGAVTLAMPFTDADGFEPPSLTANGLTPMGAAIGEAIRLVKERKEIYKENGIAYYRPWIFLITDGEPNDAWDSVPDAVQAGEERKEFSFFAIAVKGADMEVLRQISVREPLMLEGLKFQELFRWLSASLRSVSSSTPGTDVQLSSPKGWATV